LFTGFVAGYLVTRHLLAKAPVYRGGFPNHASYVYIPENRAVRVVSERVSLLDSNGNLCLGRSPVKLTLKSGIKDHLIELNTTVNYTASGNVSTFNGENKNVSLENIKEENFTVTTRARYNVSVVEESELCTQVEKQVNGTMVQMYKYNPNGASAVHVNTKLIATSISVLAIFNRLHDICDLLKV